MPSSKKKSSQNSPAPAAKFSLLADRKALDPALSSLFSSSSGPVTNKTKYDRPLKSQRDAKTLTADSVNGEEEELDEDDEELSSLDEEEIEEAGGDAGDDAGPEVKSLLSLHHSRTADRTQDESTPRKRKRQRDNEDLEDVYMQKLAREDAKEEKQRQIERKSKRQKQETKELTTRTISNEDMGVDDADNTVNEIDGDDVASEQDFVVPQHETLAPPAEDADLEKASRTVFLGNVSTTAITSKSDKKTLITHLSSFISTLPNQDPPHKVESLRFRSTAFSSHVPKKAAFARKDLMDATTKSTNAYVVYSTRQCAREAAQRLNGTVVLGRHLRVDEVAHPAKVDHHRCVFVGNLGFVDDESQMKAAAAEAEGAKKPRKTEPGDVEEGLWQQFGKAGTVESVRVVRDPKTRVGKGIAYVQFVDQNGVEAALLFNDKKFPPLLPRKLRVSRAKKPSKRPTGSNDSSRPKTFQQSGNKSSKPGAAEEHSFRGRAKKMLGRAGAANLRTESGKGARRQTITGANGVKVNTTGIKAPEAFVFEGHRASNTQGNRGLRLGGGRKKTGKPKGRSAMRGAAWKAKSSK